MTRRVAALAFATGAALTTPPAGAAVRLVESDERHALVEIVPEPAEVSPATAGDRAYVRLRIPGLGVTGGEGRPEVPSGGFRLAIPPGTTPRLRVVHEEWSERLSGAVLPVPARIGVREPFGPSYVTERMPVEAEAYRAAAVYPAFPFRLAGTKRLRDLRVVEIEYAAARAEVFARAHRLLKRAVLEISFEPDLSRAAARAERPPIRSDLWERTARSGLLNAVQARAWARGGPGDATSVGDAPWGAGDQWKIVVDRTGLAEISFATLAAAGFPAQVPIGQVALYQRTFDLDRVEDPSVAAADLFVAVPVPALARDRNANGVFDGSDGLLFWARSVRDQWMTSGWEHEDLFDTNNYVWVRIDLAGGARMPERAGGVPTATDSLPSTPSVVFREQDREYTQYPGDFGPGRGGFETEFYYWNSHRSSYDPDGEGFPIADSLVITDLVPGSSGTLRARVCPTGRPLFNGFTNVVSFSVNGTLLGQRQFYNDNLYAGGVVSPALVMNVHGIAPGVLTEGTNTFRFVGKTYPGSGTSNPPSAVARFLFDWYEVEYARRLVARGEELLLTTANGGGGPVRVRVAGFGGSDLLLIDVTDGARPVRVQLDPAQIVSAGGGAFDLRFEHDNSSGVGKYVAARESGAQAVSVAEITRVAQPGLLAGGVGARWVAVAHDELLGGARDLADYRATRYPSLAVAASEVWDVFHNGARSPVAIKSYAAYAYHRWADPLVFLLLIGDASEDHRRAGANADRDLMPSHSLWSDYEGAPEETDQYYAEVTSDGAGTFDDLSDLYVGRLALNTPDELAWNVERIRIYETENPDQLWRRKVLLLADDALSGDLGGGFGAGYGWRGISERRFCLRSAEFADSLEAHPADDILPDLLCLSEFTHPCPDTCNSYTGVFGAYYYPRDCEAQNGWDCGFWYDCRVDPQNWNLEYECMRDSVLTVFPQILKNRLNAGVLLWNYEGHANKYQLAHEYIWRDDPIDASRRDVLALRNVDRPFLFLGFACHLAEFDRSDEGALEDCVTEKMMNSRTPAQERPAGCVGAFASSGFEFLEENLNFNEYVLDAFFRPEKAGVASELPDDGSSGYVWTLGESTTRARLLFQESYPSDGRQRQAAQRFVLLGDPALSPDLGSPVLAAKINGVTVENPDDPFFVAPDDYAGSLQVEVTASDGRGITATRVVDTVRGVIPAEEYQVVTDLASPDSVPQVVTMTQELTLRPDEEYDVRYEAVDSSGKTSAFVIRTDTRFYFQDHPVAFPNPFLDRTSVAFKTTRAIRSATLRVFTVNGKRIREIHGGSLPANVQHAIEWDGRDDQGLEVANGTYLVKLSLDAATGGLAETLPIVRIR